MASVDIMSRPRTKKRKKGKNVIISGENVGISEKAVIEDNCKISATEIKIGDYAHIGKNVTISGEKIDIGEKVMIEDDCKILSKEFFIGWKSHIEKECSCRAIGGKPAEKIIIGDGSFIGFGANTLVPVLKIGDYTIIHNHVLINGYEPCVMGHNCYFMQYCVLNSTKKLTIGNNVGVGLNTSIWTHTAWGELLEGCNLYLKAPTTVEDEVVLWGGLIVVNPGLTLGKRSIVLPGAVVTKDTLPGHCYGGIPARDMTEKMKPYREITVNEKYSMMKKFTDEFVRSISEIYNVQRLDRGYLLTSKEYKFKILFLEEVKQNFPNEEDLDIIVITKRQDGIALGDRVSVFDLQTKHYTKKRLDAEFMFIKFLDDYKARFLPKD